MNASYAMIIIIVWKQRYKEQNKKSKLALIFLNAQKKVSTAIQEAMESWNVPKME